VTRSPLKDFLYGNHFPIRISSANPLQHHPATCLDPIVRQATILLVSVTQGFADSRMRIYSKS